MPRLIQHKPASDANGAPRLPLAPLRPNRPSTFTLPPKQFRGDDIQGCARQGNPNCTVPYSSLGRSLQFQDETSDDPGTQGKQKTNRAAGRVDHVRGSISAGDLDPGDRREGARDLSTTVARDRCLLHFHRLAPPVLCSRAVAVWTSVPEGAGQRGARGRTPVLRVCQWSGCAVTKDGGAMPHQAPPAPTDAAPSLLGPHSRHLVLVLANALPGCLWPKRDAF